MSATQEGIRKKCATIDGWDRPRSGLFEIIVDAWWLVDDAGNPLFSGKYRSPQCNQSESLARRIFGEVKHIPVVYVPIRIQDYTR